MTVLLFPDRCPHECCLYPHGPEIGHKEPPETCLMCAMPEILREEREREIREWKEKND